MMMKIIMITVDDNQLLCVGKHLKKIRIIIKIY